MKLMFQNKFITKNIYMKFLKKLILFFSFSFGTFCNDDYYDDDDDYEEVEIVKKKKINKKNKRKNKKSKGRSGIIHTLTDKIHSCVEFNIINASNVKEIAFNKGLKEIDNKINASLSILKYLCLTTYSGYNFNNSKGVSLKFGFANTLQTQINRYQFKVGVVFRYNLNLLLSLRLLFESGVGYCFWLDEDNRKFNIENGKSPIYKNLSSFFDTKLDPLIFCANFGIGFLFFSVHIGGEVSLSRLLSTRNSTSVNNSYKKILDGYINEKGIDYLVDILNVSLRIYPLIFVDYLIGWLI